MTDNYSKSYDNKLGTKLRMTKESTTNKANTTQKSLQKSDSKSRKSPTQGEKTKHKEVPHVHEVKNPEVNISTSDSDLKQAVQPILTSTNVIQVRELPGDCTTTTSDITTDIDDESLSLLDSQLQITCTNQAQKGDKKILPEMDKHKHISVTITELDQDHPHKRECKVRSTCKCRKPRPCDCKYRSMEEVSNSSFSEEVKLVDIGKITSVSSQETKLIDPLRKTKSKISNDDLITLYNGTLKKFRSTGSLRETVVATSTQTGTLNHESPPKYVCTNTCPAYSSLNKHAYCQQYRCTNVLTESPQKIIESSKTVKTIQGNENIVSCKCDANVAARNSQKEESSFWKYLFKPRKKRMKSSTMTHHTMICPHFRSSFQGNKELDNGKPVPLICVSNVHGTGTKQMPLTNIQDVHDSSKLYRMSIIQGQTETSPREIVFDRMTEEEKRMCECSVQVPSAVNLNGTFNGTDNDPLCACQEAESPDKAFASSKKRIDVYYFDHGNSAYYRITDNPPPVLTDDLIDQADDISTKFWSEIFGTLTLGLTFVTNFILQFLKFVLVSLIRPLFSKSLQVVGDYCVKPLLAILFNGIIQPFLIFLYNVAKSIRDICEPLARAGGFWFRELGHLFRAIRLIEINHDKRCDKCMCI